MPKLFGTKNFWKMESGGGETDLYASKVNLFLGSQQFLKCGLDDTVLQIPNSFGTENYDIHMKR